MNYKNFEITINEYSGMFRCKELQIEDETFKGICVKIHNELELQKKEFKKIPIIFNTSINYFKGEITSLGDNNSVWTSIKNPYGKSKKLKLSKYFAKKCLFENTEENWRKIKEMRELQKQIKKTLTKPKFSFNEKTE